MTPGPVVPPVVPAVVAAWERRFRAARVSLPQWARDAPERCLYVSNATGVYELYAWDRGTGRHRRVTDRPQGTHVGALDPDGESIWWFSDTDGDEYGGWLRQPFDGGEDVAAVPGLERSYSAGLALGRGGVAVVGQSGAAGPSGVDGTRIVATRALAPTGEPAGGGRGLYEHPVYEHREDAAVGDLSRDGTLVAIEHSEHGDSRHRALRVLRLPDGRADDRGDGAVPVADLRDGPGRGLEVLGFSPVEGDPRLLVGHERRGRSELLLWDVATGEQRELRLDLEFDLQGELEADWYPDGTALLVVHAQAARSELYRYDLTRRALEPVDTPPGVVRAATARPDGTVEFSWSSSAEPPVVRAAGGGVVLAPPGEPAPPSVPVEDAWVDGPSGVGCGRIHALVSRPETGGPPYPTVFLVHGGPTWQDSDSFAPDVAAYVDAGYAVVRANYRGSTGYGTAWRDALEGRVGRTELEDLAAVRAWAVDSGLADPARIVLSGGSWGGYLTLLGLGTQPQLWSLGVAAVPVADYVAAYEDEMEALKAFDRALFGGSPQDVPEAYREASPITYVDAVRVPVLVLAGANDPRCPIRQIENYLAALAARGAAHEVYRYDAGHGSLVVEERIAQMRVELDFLARHLP